MFMDILCMMNSVKANFKTKEHLENITKKSNNGMLRTEKPLMPRVLRSITQVKEFKFQLN